MSRLSRRIAMVLAGLVAVTTSAAAQRRIRGGRAVTVEPPAVGPRVGYDFDVKHVFVGGQLNLPVGRRWALAPSLELYPGAIGSPYRLHADLKYHPQTAYGLFYFGGGFSYFHVSGGGDAGGNVLAGWEGLRAHPVRPFLESKVVFSDRTSVNIEAGLNFPL